MFLNVFWKWQKLIPIIAEKRWEVLTWAKSNDHFAKCFGSQVHQVLYLCSREPRGTSGTFLGMDRILFHSGAGTLYARGISSEIDKLAKTTFHVFDRYKIHTRTVVDFSNLKLIVFDSSSLTFCVFRISSFYNIK